MIAQQEKSSRSAFMEALSSAVLALVLTFAIVGMRTRSDEAGVLFVDYRWDDVAVIVATVFFVRLLLPIARSRLAGLLAGAGLVFALVLTGWSTLLSELQYVTLLVGSLVLALTAISNILRGNGTVRKLLARSRSGAKNGPADQVQGNKRMLVAGGVVFALAFPFFPGTDRYWLDLAILILTYLVLGWGLNIVVGLAGLLDLGFVAFYAVGAYSYSLLAIHYDVSFWVALPFAAMLAALFGFLLGFPVLRLRGDYFAIVTLGFGEIIRVILLNWVAFTGGPDGLSGIPRPSFFGIADFARSSPDGGMTFHQMFGLDYSTQHRIVFLYFVVLVLAAFACHVAARLKKMPIGRAWEALREDDIACQAMGVSRTSVKLWAFMISAAFGGVAGAFFATRQGYVSPESFTFIESAIVLAIVVLGGMGSLTGVFLATLVIVGLPEVFREIENFRMLAFGAAMVMIMIWRPNGILSKREPSVRYAQMKRPPERITSKGVPV
ncbi:high-affinity branched-chain amino acid ABC transporter permease LivM [Roseibium sp.]|uniref:high-affinity branched-chain amino acid ABC transporter permease LivM n=1 Tax=Roseibium sp. TaxID=1936156 RepID=UPI0035121EB8